MYRVCLQRQNDAFDGTNFVFFAEGGLPGESGASVFGHACASKAISVGAIDWREGDGPGGAFEGAWLQEMARFFPLRLPLPGFPKSTLSLLPLPWAPFFLLAGILADLSAVTHRS